MKLVSIICFCFLLTMSYIVNAQTQIELNSDAIEAFYKADKELNQVYKQLMVKLSEQEKSSLKDQQRKWIKMKESTCKKEADEYKGGSMAPMILFSCYEEKTKKRTTELRGMLQGR